MNNIATRSNIRTIFSTNRRIRQKPPNNINRKSLIPRHRRRIPILTTLTNNRPQKKRRILRSPIRRTTIIISSRRQPRRINRINLSMKLLRNLITTRTPLQPNFTTDRKPMKRPDINGLTTRIRLLPSYHRTRQPYRQALSIA